MVKKQKMVEVCRSFSYKLNLGNYQTADFFCSQKAEIPLIEAEQVSELLFEFCKKEVIKSVNQYKAEFLPEPHIEKVKKWLTKEEAEEKQKVEEKIEGDFKERAIKEEEKEKMAEAEAELRTEKVESIQTIEV